MRLTPITAVVRAPALALSPIAWDDLGARAPKPSRVLSRWLATRGGDVYSRANVARPNRRSYAGSQNGRTTADWMANSTSADTELYTGLRTLRNRSRQLVRDNEYAGHIVERVIPNNVVGQGIRFQAQVMMRRANKLDERVNDSIETEWKRWSRAEHCHTAGRMSFQDIERLVMRNVPEAGEILVRMIKRSFAGSRVPFALEIIEADQLVDNWSGRTVEGREVRMGVEVDEWQRPVAYWLYPRHPGDFTIASTAPSNDWIRVPADEILHIGLFDRPMQTRCVPWLHNVLVKLRHMGGYEEAEIVRARASASVMGFIESPEIDTPLSPDDPMNADDVVDGEKVFDMSPGIIKELAPGEKFSGFAPTAANTAIEPFMRFMVRSVMVGSGVSYESGSRDYSQSNYSSSRLALTEDRDHWRVLQAWLIRRFHQRVFEAWLDMAVLAGVLNLPAYESAPEIYQAVKWSPRGWDWIDPLKEIAAYKAAVRAGFMTVDDVIAAKGGDVEDTFKNRRRELDLAADYALVLDTDPAQVDNKGIVQPLDPLQETDTGLDADGDPLPGGEGPKQDDATASSQAAQGKALMRRRRLERLEERQDALLLAAIAIDTEMDQLRAVET
jgi:lambda family phage portal protein